MPYVKNKSENYTNLGGLNTKISQYIEGPMEFLELTNVDFRKTGALSSFDGFTNWAGNVTVDQPILGFIDYTYPTIIPGTTFNPIIDNGGLLSASNNSVNISGLSAIGGTYIFTETIYNYLYPNNNNPVALTRGSYVYGANGLDFFTFNTWMLQRAALSAFPEVTQFSLPKPMVSYSLSPVGFTAIGTTSLMGFSGTVQLFFSFLRTDGFVGPFTAATSALTLYGQTILTFQGVTFNQSYISPNSPSGLELTDFNIIGYYAWISLNGSVPQRSPLLYGMTNGSGLVTYSPPGTTGSAIPFVPGPLIQFTTTDYGETIYAYEANTSFPLVNDIQPQDFQGSYMWGVGSTQGSDGSTAIVANAPSILEIFNNQLFYAGIYNQDRVIFSNLNNYEMSDYTNYFDVKLADGDSVSCIKSYFTALMIHKTHSTYVLTGTDPSNFVLSFVSDVYGCLSARASCVFEQTYWFLDRKGICQYNGANVQIVSSKIENIFKSMNVSAARTASIMVHVKNRNEVWCAIPINGATVPNILIVYDYVTQAWTTRTVPFQISSLFVATSSVQGIGDETPFIGGSAGLINFMGVSLSGIDIITPGSLLQGQGFTHQIKTRFVNAGHSTEQMWRRLYLDATVPAGMTYVFAVNFYTDQGTSPSYQTTMILTSFQNRIDFGLPARDISVELFYITPVGQNGVTFAPLQLNGYTLEYRFQRAV